MSVGNDHRNSGCVHWTWWFSIAMQQITRGYFRHGAFHDDEVGQSSITLCIKKQSLKVRCLSVMNHGKSWEYSRISLQTNVWLPKSMKALVHDQWHKNHPTTIGLNPEWPGHRRYDLVKLHGSSKIIVIKFSSDMFQIASLNPLRPYVS